MQPIVIIGAPRSGTNLLRDLLAQLPGAGTWPCDEINAIWRHGNVSYPSDELPTARATPRVRSFIRGAFEDLASSRNLEIVVEKTCANSLRVPFVRRILPDARYVFLVRDGRDAVASAIRCWHRGVQWTYTLRKARFVPAADVAHYAGLFATNRLGRLLRRDRSLRTWGPRFDGIEEVARALGVAAACVRQWTRCVAAATRDLGDLGPDRLARVRYEELVERPAAELARLASFLGVGCDEDRARLLTAHVDPDRIGSRRAHLEARELQIVEKMLAPRLESLLGAALAGGPS